MRAFSHKQQLEMRDLGARNLHEFHQPLDMLGMKLIQPPNINRDAILGREVERFSGSQARCLVCHGEPIDDAAARAGEIIRHHRKRLDVVSAALKREPQSGYQLSIAVFGRELGPAQRRFAVAETLSHLERLVREGRAARSGAGRTVTYTGP